MNKEQWGELYWQAHGIWLDLLNAKIETGDALMKLSSSKATLDPDESKQLAYLANRLTKLVSLLWRAEQRRERRWQWYQHTKDEYEIIR